MEGDSYKRYYKDSYSSTYDEQEKVAKESLQKYEKIREELPRILKLPWEEIKNMTEEEWNERFEEIYGIDPEPYLEN